MAQTVAVDSWSGRGVRLGDVVRALGDLRQGQERLATRTAVMTLVAVVTTDESAWAAKEALHALGGQHPARIVIMRPNPDGVAALDATASLARTTHLDHEVNFEEVVLTIGGQAALHLDSIVEAFTLADLPVAVWYVGTPPDPKDSLLSVATAVVLDSRHVEDAHDLRALLELARRRTVVDLSWIRLRPWRQLLASLFEPEAYRDFAGGVNAARVQGQVAPRLLLAGWLISQLQLSPRQVSLVDARHVSIALECELDGLLTASFDVRREEGTPSVSAGVTVAGGPSLRQRLSLAEDALAASLADALTHLEPDVVWEQALSAAAQLCAFSVLGVNGELIVVDDLPGAFAERVIEAYRARPDELFSLALSGGSTARACYERLAAESDSAIDWLSVNVYWGDERCVPGDDPDSNQLLVRQSLLERVGTANAVYPMRCDDGPDAYQLRLGEIGQLDVVHLGMGPDGHTASLFPGSEALDADPGQLVALNVDPSGLNPHPRMTLTFAGLARARLVIFTVAGEAKRATLQAVMDGADLPAGRVEAERVVWLVDREAAPR